MADIAPKATGLRAKLGFGPRRNSETPRKLVKKSIPNSETNEAPERRALTNEYQRAPASTMQQSISSTRSDSTWSLGTTDAQSIRKGSASVKAPRKLSKASHQLPQTQPHVLDKDTGERKDVTDMLHAFSYSDVPETVPETYRPASPIYDSGRPDGAALLARLSPELWALIGDYLSPLEIANLFTTCRTMHQRMVNRAYDVLRDPSNRTHRLEFLLDMDHKLPNHLFCFPCAQWHFRTQPGFEALKAPTVLNPLFDCPNSTNNLLPPPRLRITEGRSLPFTFVQLAKRAWKYGSEYGISIQSLARRWKDPYSSWTHESMYHIHKNGHILMRIKSQIFVHEGMTPTAKRLLLFNRGDYTPYFSVCAHWQKGVLTSIPKCALDHIPVPTYNAYTQLRTPKASGPVALCAKCKPMRRCPQCPSEYLVELKIVEDTNEKSGGAARFKQCLLITRWSDLGPARSPEDEEWAAITGAKRDYKSIVEIGKRAVSGVFESAFTDAIPGQRILSMNPVKRRGFMESKGEEDVTNEDDWY